MIVLEIIYQKLFYANFLDEKEKIPIYFLVNITTKFDLYSNLKLKSWKLETKYWAIVKRMTIVSMEVVK